MDTNKMDTGVQVHVTDMDTRNLKIVTPVSTALWPGKKRVKLDGYQTSYKIPIFYLIQISKSDFRGEKIPNFYPRLRLLSGNARLIKFFDENFFSLTVIMTAIFRFYHFFNQWLFSISWSRIHGQINGVMAVTSKWLVAKKIIVELPPTQFTQLSPTQITNSRVTNSSTARAF